MLRSIKGGGGGKRGEERQASQAFHPKLDLNDFRLSGIKGVQARDIAPVSKEHGNFKPLRA